MSAKLRKMTINESVDFEIHMKNLRQIILEYNSIQHSLISDLKIDKIEQIRRVIRNIEGKTDVKDFLDVILQVCLEEKSAELKAASSEIEQKFNMSIDYSKSLQQNRKNAHKAELKEVA